MLSLRCLFVRCVRALLNVVQFHRTLRARIPNKCTEIDALWAWPRLRRLHPQTGLLYIVGVPVLTSVHDVVHPVAKIERYISTAEVKVPHVDPLPILVELFNDLSSSHAELVRNRGFKVLENNGKRSSTARRSNVVIVISRIVYVANFGLVVTLLSTSTEPGHLVSCCFVYQCEARRRLVQLTQKREEMFEERRRLIQEKAPRTCTSEKKMSFIVSSLQKFDNTNAKISS